MSAADSVTTPKHEWVRAEKCLSIHQIKGKFKARVQELLDYITDLWETGQIALDLEHLQTYNDIYEDLNTCSDVEWEEFRLRASLAIEEMNVIHKIATMGCTQSEKMVLPGEENPERPRLARHKQELVAAYKECINMVTEARTQAWNQLGVVRGIHSNTPRVPAPHAGAHHGGGAGSKTEHQYEYL